MEVPTTAAFVICISVAGPALQRLGMANLDWVVVRDLAMIESATFWKDAPEVETGEIAPDTCRTEVFFFPSAQVAEYDGSFTNTQRLLQWRDKAVELRKKSQAAQQAKPAA